MSVKTRNFTLLSAALAALFLLAMTLTTCDSPLGFGDPIDWEPPELKMDPGTNPRYVNNSTILAGTVGDNIGVSRVILRAAADSEKLGIKIGDILFNAALSPRERSAYQLKHKTEYRWEIELNFPVEWNGEKIAVEIVAFDFGPNNGNSGESATAAISLIIDNTPPLIDSVWIDRTPLKTFISLEPLADLVALENETDPNGELVANVNKYQNGSFYIKAKLVEDETRIKQVKLYLYDVGREPEPDPDEPLLILDMEGGASANAFAPTWLLKEEAILEAGKTKWGADYETAYKSGTRYYFLVAVVAYDQSDNRSFDFDEYFCLWYDSDFPKGILDPIVGTGNEIIVPLNASLPIEFFDDDSLAWAYAGMLTSDQWNGTTELNAGLKIPQTGGEEAKLNWLMDKLLDKTEIYNWKYDKRSGNVDNKDKITELLNLAADKTLDEKVVTVLTGEKNTDYGTFVLVTFAGDKKLAPHDTTDITLNKKKGRVKSIRVIDENVPLIVFDTADIEKHRDDPTYEPLYKPNDPDTKKYLTGSSPEENTFPTLTNGSLFEINGYTLRENGNGHNAVEKFRIAWIPFTIEGGADTLIPQVQRALSSSAYPDGDWPAGVQHWELHNSSNPLAPEMVEGSPFEISDIPYRKQIFRKTFDVLGGKDVDKHEYNNFTYNGKLENETKLFIFYAEDNLGNDVFRELRLLSNKNPPEIFIYDLTTIEVPDFENEMKYSTYSPALPNLNNDDKTNDNYYFFNLTGNIDDIGRNKYRQRLLAYQPRGYEILRGLAMSGDTLRLSRNDLAEPSTAYPRETTLKFWVTTEGKGQIAIKNVQMQDLTFESIAKYNAGSFEGKEYAIDSEARSDDPQHPKYQNKDNPIGYEKPKDYPGDLSLSFVEMVPEVMQRVLLFTATDMLGNTASAQRTIAVTNAAILKNITTAEQTGSYGIGKMITIKANFTNLVKWTGTDAPRLNVRYNQNGNRSIKQIATTTPVNTPSLSLDFDLVVAQNDTGVLETIYFNIGDSNGYTAQGNDEAKNNRPITIPEGTRILDASRGDDAFTPRNVPGFDWTNLGKGPTTSLQGSKTITLDGVRPTISSFVLNPPTGKKQYTVAEGNPGYYFKADETIQFTLTASRDIFTKEISPPEVPTVQFQIGGSGAWHDATWQRSSSATAMVFSALVSATMNDGNVTGIRLKNVSTIVDSVDNAFAAGASTYTITNAALTGVNTIRVDKGAPNKPPTSLTPFGTTTPVEITETTPANTNYNATPSLTVTRTAAAAGDLNAPAKTEYSLNNGVTWVEFPTATDDYTNPDSAQQAIIRALNWTSVATANTSLYIKNGQWILQTRFTDRAGNVGDPTTKAIHVNMAFPNLIAVANVNADGWYRAGTSISLKLDFAEAVRVTNAAQVQIVLTNRDSDANNTGAGDNNMILSAAANQTNIDRQGNTTIIFEWNTIGAKEMRDGMYISYIRLNGLQDRFGNAGPAMNTTQIAYTNSTSNPSPIGGANGPFANPAIPNLSVTISNNVVNAVKVDGITPTVTGRTPAINTVSSYPGATDAADKRNVITLTFREPIIKGNGTITIKPQRDFLIPPVFEDNGYYVDCVTEAKAAASSNRTIWMPGFYDIYTNSALSATDRNRLTESTTEASQRASPTNAVVPSSALDETNPSMTRLRLDARTGQPVGPYVKTTQGLKSGYGYSGQYNGGNNTTGNTSNSAETAFFKNGPNTNGSASGLNGAMPAFTAMIPDTATKWVLAYQYSIHDNTSSQENPARTANGYGKTATNLTGVVPAIRDVLIKTKFRWQEIDVAWNNVVITTNTSGQGVATITLNEPLLRGLQWELTYPAETFTDQAGNNAAAIGADAYTFWSEGVQKPVIRVNRKSYDARTANWQTPRTAAATVYENTRSYTYAAPAANSGWNITDFNTVDYRIESETPGASLAYAVTTLSNSTTTGTGNGAFNAVSVTGDWTGNVPNVTAVTNQYTQDTWNRLGDNEPRSFWVRPNLIRRDGYSGAGDAWDAAARCRYYVNGDIRYSAGTLKMYRSYNRDATSQTAAGFTGLDVLTLSNTQAGGWYKGTTTFDAYEAGKKYVVATASRDTYTSNRGYEGIFRTLIVLNGQNGGGRTNNNGGDGLSRGKILVEGSDIKAGMPSVAGFPVQDGSDSGDSRFAKMMFNVDSPNPNADIALDAATNRRFYWVSTEIVCEWYFVYFGNGGRYMRTGDVNNYMMVSYGDLTYGYRVHRFPDGAN